jgi:hypothetical protein
MTFAVYEEWIKSYIARNNGDVWMKCVEACEAMLQAFPELTIVRGIAVSSVSGKRWCHCWVVTPAGEVLDPTARQFGGLPVVYEPPTHPPALPQSPSTVRT